MNRVVAGRIDALPSRARSCRWSVPKGRVLAENLEETYRRATARKLCDTLLCVSGHVEITDTQLTLTFGKCAPNPDLVDLGIS